MVLIDYNDDTLIIIEKHKIKNGNFYQGIAENANGQLFNCLWKNNLKIDWEHPDEIKHYRKKKGEKTINEY